MNRYTHDRPVYVEAVNSSSAPNASLRHCQVIQPASHFHHSCVTDLDQIFEMIQAAVVCQECSELWYRLPRYHSAAAAAAAA